MLPTSNPDRIDIAFDDDRLVDHAGLLLPATLAGRLGLRELTDAHLDVGDAAGRANVGDKLLTLVARRSRAVTASMTPLPCAPVAPGACSAAP